MLALQQGLPEGQENKGPGHAAKSLTYRLQRRRQKEPRLLAQGADNHAFAGAGLSVSDRQKGGIISHASRTPTQASPGLRNPLHARAATEAAGGMRLPRSVASASTTCPGAWHMPTLWCLTLSSGTQLYGVGCWVVGGERMRIVSPWVLFVDAKVEGGAYMLPFLSRAGTSWYP